MFCLILAKCVLYDCSYSVDDQFVDRRTLFLISICIDQYNLHISCWLLVNNFVKFVLLKFKIKLQDMNHLYVFVQIRFDDSTGHLSSGSAVII